MSQVHPSNKYWYLVTSEDGIEQKKFQVNFPPEDFVIMTGSADVAEFSGYGMPYPILQWVRGTSDEITFNSMIWYEDYRNYHARLEPREGFDLVGGGMADIMSGVLSESGYTGSTFNLDTFYLTEETRRDIRDRLDTTNIYVTLLKDKILELQSLKNPIKKLGRPPICIFKWSSWFIKCMVISVTNITPMFPASSVDHPLGYRFSVTLRRYVDYNDNLANTDYTHGWTKRITAIENDTYEMIAYREYGDPQLGIALRRLHPSKPNVSPGDVVYIPSKEWAKTQVGVSRIHLSHLFSPDAEQYITDLYDFLSE